MNPFEAPVEAPDEREYIRENAWEQILKLEHSQRNMTDEQAEIFMQAYEVLEESLEELGGRAVEGGDNREIMGLAKKYPSLIVRRESPKALIGALATGDFLHIRFDPEAHGGDPYPNAATIGSDASGMRVPFQRGFGGVSKEEGGKGKIITIAGFLPGKRLHVERMSREAYPHYKASAERNMIRMVSGEVSPEELKFIMFRIPRSYAPEEFATEIEEEQQTFFYTRTFLFNEETVH